MRSVYLWERLSKVDTHSCGDLSEESQLTDTAMLDLDVSRQIPSDLGNYLAGFTDANECVLSFVLITSLFSCSQL